MFCRTKEFQIPTHSKKNIVGLTLKSSQMYIYMYLLKKKRFLFELSTVSLIWSQLLKNSYSSILNHDTN